MFDNPVVGLLVGVFFGVLGVALIAGCFFPKFRLRDSVDAQLPIPVQSGMGLVMLYLGAGLALSRCGVNIMRWSVLVVLIVVTVGSAILLEITKAVRGRDKREQSSQSHN